MESTHSSKLLAKILRCTTDAVQCLAAPSLQRKSSKHNMCEHCKLTVAVVCKGSGRGPADSFRYVVDNLLRKANFEASSSSRGRPEAEGRVRVRVCWSSRVRLREGCYLI